MVGTKIFYRYHVTNFFFSFQGIDVLLNSLRENKTIVSLFLDGNNLGYTFWVKLFQYLEKHPTLVKLDTPEKDIARAISANKEKKRDILSLWADIQQLCLNRRTQGSNPNYSEYRSTLSLTKQLDLIRADQKLQQPVFSGEDSSDQLETPLSPRGGTSPQFSPVVEESPVSYTPVAEEPKAFALPPVQVVEAPRAVIPPPAPVPEPVRAPPAQPIEDAPPEPVQVRTRMPILKQQTPPPGTAPGVSPSQVKPGMMRPARKKVQSMDMFGTIYGSQDPLLEGEAGAPGSSDYVMAETIPPEDLPDDPAPPEHLPPEPEVTPAPVPAPIARAAEAPRPQPPTTPNSRGPPAKAAPPVPAPRMLTRAGTVGNASSKLAPPPPARPQRALGRPNES